MRILAWFLVAVVLICGALLGYSLYAAALHVTVQGVQVVPAAQMPDAFAALRQQMQDEALLGTVFREGPLGEMEDYVFHLYTVQVSNRGFLPADWIKLDVQPAPGDVLQSEPETANMLPALQNGALQATVLAEAGTPTARELRIAYFVFGRPYSLTVQQP